MNNFPNESNAQDLSTFSNGHPGIGIFLYFSTFFCPKECSGGYMALSEKSYSLRLVSKNSNNCELTVNIFSKI